MNPNLLMKKIQSSLNKELIRRLLIRYFHTKGYKDDFSQSIHPPTIADLPQAIPQLAAKIEIEPHVIDIIPQTGQIKLGWNLFILGTKRIFLGESDHSNLAEVQQSVQGPLQMNNTPTTKCTTPKKIIEFIADTLANDKEGDITTTPNNITMPKPTPMSHSLGDQSGYFRRSQRPVY